MSKKNPKLLLKTANYEPFPAVTMKMRNLENTPPGNERGSI